MYVVVFAGFFGVGRRFSLDTTFFVEDPFGFFTPLDGVFDFGVLGVLTRIVSSFEVIFPLFFSGVFASAALVVARCDAGTFFFALPVFFTPCFVFFVIASTTRAMRSAGCVNVPSLAVRGNNRAGFARDGRIELRDMVRCVCVYYYITLMSARDRLARGPRSRFDRRQGRRGDTRLCRRFP